MRAFTNTHKARGSVSLLLAAAVVVLLLVAVVLSQAYALRGARHDLSTATARADQAVQALGTERQQRDLANRSVLNLTNQLDAQRENADAILTGLSHALHGAPDASLPGSVGRVLRDITITATAPRDAAPAARAGKAAAQADPAERDREAADVQADSVSCAAIATWGAENIELVLKPNALQLEEVQAFYEKQRLLLLFLTEGAVK